MPKTSKTPISDKAAFDAYPYAIGGRVIAAKVVMFSVAEKLELELAELRRQVEKMKTCENCLEHYRDTDYKSQCLSHNTTARGVRSMKLCLDHGKKFWRLKI